MAQKKWVISLSAFLLVTLLFAGYMAMAAELGSRDDPLLTASYITEELMPGLSKKIDDAVAAKSDEYMADMDKKYDSLMKDMQMAVDNFNKGFSGDMTDQAFIDAVAAAVVAKQGGGSSGAADSMKKVNIPKGKTMTLPLGGEVMLRVGSAEVVADGTPGLIDLTTGGDLSNGKPLEKSHLYMSTVVGRGIKASAETTTVFVRGSYVIG